MLRENFHLLRAGSAAHLTVHIARHWDEVKEAQRLRYQVFAEEMGARLSTREPGLDHDIFDRYCDHVIVRDQSTLDVVGTYRMLNPERAKAIGSYYAETEFHLTRLRPLFDRMVEVGRSCVHPAYRTGPTIALLWAGVSKYMQQHGYDYVMGCASISMADGGHAAASIYRRLEMAHMSPYEWRVYPRCRLPLEALDGTIAAPVPPLIKGYMRLGCLVCGEPAWDPDFNTADLLVMLPMSLMNKRYARHFNRE